MCCSLGSVLLLMIPCVDKMTIAVDTPINLRPSSVQARTGPQVLIQLHLCMDQIACSGGTLLTWVLLGTEQDV